MEAIDGVLYLEPRLVYDAALVGHTRDPKDHWPRTTDTLVAIYDYDKCVAAVLHWLHDEKEVDADADADAEEKAFMAAVEHVNFNVMGAWVGDGTPTFRMRDDEDGCF